MVLKLYNTLTRTEEEFKPLKGGEVSMYSCGPTVYDYAHIGNFRAAIFNDTLRRVLEYNGYEVKHVTNVTDVGHLVSDADIGEDKMSKALRRENKEMTIGNMREIGKKYTDSFIQNIELLNTKPPYKIPVASDHIKEDLEIVEILLKKEIAYKSEDGIYFDVSKFGIDKYNQIFGINSSGDEEFARVIPVAGKRNHQDFALWKFSKPNQDGFNYPEFPNIPKGFPGWHIECSAMSRKYLGQPFDIHTGGSDLVSIHHKNEIAQSEAAFDKPLANYWLHSAFVNVYNGKMSKSIGNFITLRDIEAKNLSPLAYRYLTLTSHYRSQLNFTWESLSAAQITLDKLYDFYLNLGEETGKISKTHQVKFSEAINNDLNTPQAIALVWELIKNDSASSADKRATLLDFDKVLGLGLLDVRRLTVEIPAEVQALANEREAARQNKDWSRSDALRSEIEAKGWAISDTDDGPELKPNLSTG